MMNRFLHDIRFGGRKVITPCEGGESVSEISNDIIGESAESLTEPQKQEVKNKINIDE